MVIIVKLIKPKIENSIEDIQNELKIQNNKLDRIKKSYLNGTFTLKEFDNEKRIIGSANFKIY